jgi:MATE family multidrug resistance protein
MTDTALRILPINGEWRREAQAMLSLAWPLVLTNLTQTAMTAVDVILIGRLSPGALAASALAVNLYFALMIFAIGVVISTAPMIARELGARKHAVRELRRTFRQGMWSAVAVTIPIWIVLWFTEPILLFLRQEPSLASMAGQYMRALEWALLPFLFFIVLRSVVSAMERPMAAFWIGLGGVIFNAIAAWALIFGNLGFPRLELVGAGIATTAACTLMFVGLALYVTFERRFRRYRLFGRFWRPDWHRFREIWRLGLPIGFALAFEVTVFNAAVFLMGLINTDSLAAHAIAIQIASITFMIPLGIGQAVTVRVGRAFGAGDPDAIGRAGWTAYAMSLSFMAVAALAMIFAPRPLIGVFIHLDDPANASVVGLAVTFLIFAGFFQLFDGAQAVASGMLRGLHDTRVPMIYAAIGYWGVGLPLGAILAFWGGYEGAGIWAGLAIGLAVVAVLMTARWIMRDRLKLVPHRALSGAA